MNSNDSSEEGNQEDQDFVVEEVKDFWEFGTICIFFEMFRHLFDPEFHFNPMVNILLFCVHSYIKYE